MLNELKYFLKKHLPSRSFDRLSSLAKPALGILPSLANRLTGHAFYCKVLSGESKYNLCVNSDMTVSCNCSDMDGKGHLGDLSKQSLKEILDGPTARAFRSRLARGHFAIHRCQRCPELTRIEKKAAAFHVDDYGSPKGIMVENTVRCNLQCRWCPRDEILRTRGARAMSLKDMEKVAETLRDCEIEEVSFFNLGEPFFSKRLLEELTLIRKYAPSVYLHTSTNGVLVDNDAKREAALLMDKIDFSVDGSSQEKVLMYQVGAHFERSYENMVKLTEYRDSRASDRPFIEWKYVVFAWNDSEEDIERAVELARQAKVDAISFFYGDGPSHFRSKRFRTAPHFTNMTMHHDHHYRVDL